MQEDFTLHHISTNRQIHCNPGAKLQHIILHWFLSSLLVLCSNGEVLEWRWNHFGLHPSIRLQLHEPGHPDIPCCWPLSLFGRKMVPKGRIFVHSCCSWWSHRLPPFLCPCGSCVHQLGEEANKLAQTPYSRGRDWGLGVMSSWLLVVVVLVQFYTYYITGRGSLVIKKQWGGDSQTRPEIGGAVVVGMWEEDHD